MRLLRIVVFSLAITCGPLAARAATYVSWQGEAIITAASGACTLNVPERNRIAVGTVLKSILRPALLGDNGNDSRISFVHDSETMFALDLAGGLNLPGSGTYTAYGVTEYDAGTASPLIKANVGGQYQAFALTPVSPTATTKFVNLRGTVSDFMFIPGCKVTFRASYSLRAN